MNSVNKPTEAALPETQNSENSQDAKMTKKPSSETETPKLSPAHTELFRRIIASDLITLSVQKDAPDPSVQDKMEFLRCLLEEKPAQFLYRYSSCLKPEEGRLFKEQQSDPAVAHYLGLLIQRTNDRKVIRNRRYTRMQELLVEGTYFSDEEMQKRDPKLHYQMIGQFETEEEREAKLRESMLRNDAKFSSFLLHQSDRQDYLDKTAGNEEEEEEDEDSDDNDMLQQTGSKEELVQQFQSIMIQRFLAGQDTDHISYLDIDGNEKYDDLNMRSRDAEDKYFDGESDDESNVMLEPDDREFNPPPLRARDTCAES